MDDILLRAQPAEAEAVAPAGLLDQRRHPQRAEDAVVRPPHVVFDRQNEAGGQLAERRARAGEGGAVGEETQLGQKIVEDLRRPLHVAAVLLFDRRDVAGDAVKHARRRLQKLAVDVPPQVAALQHLEAVLAKLDCAVIHVGRAGDPALLTLNDFEGREGLLCVGAVVGDGGFTGGHGEGLLAESTYLLFLL